MWLEGSFKKVLKLHIFGTQEIIIRIKYYVCRYIHYVHTLRLKTLSKVPIYYIKYETFNNSQFSVYDAFWWNQNFVLDYHREIISYLFIIRVFCDVLTYKLYYVKYRFSTNNQPTKHEQNSFSTIDKLIYERFSRKH